MRIAKSYIKDETGKIQSVIPDYNIYQKIVIVYSDGIKQKTYENTSKSI